MAKRLAVAFFVVLGVCILVVSSFLLVLFLAPGFSAFGIKYIAKGARRVYFDETRLVEASAISGDFNGSIIINTHEIPIEICYSSIGDTEGQIRFKYVDDFNGITNSKIEDPTFTIFKDENGNAVITTGEFNKFLYESSTSDRLLKIYIPARFAADNKTNIIINSSSSPVSFYLENEADAGFIPTYKNLKITTSGKISIKHKIVAETYTMSSNSSIDIGTDEQTNINAEHYVLTSGSGRVVVRRPVSGDIQATTKSGDIKFVSCKNLIAKTESGNILSSTEEETIVEGLVNISTKSGSVSISKILGQTESSEAENNKITTSSGNVVIGKIFDGEITTSRGSVKIKNSNNLKITTNMGGVTVEEALSAINVNTRRGNVYLGGTGITMNNPTAFSRTGKIFIYSSSGEANVQTVSSNINFVNTSCTSTTITSGGKLIATNLSGKVNISSQKDIDISFNVIDEDTTITLADTVTFAKVSAIKNTARNTRFYLKGKTATRYELGATGTYSKVSTDSESASDPTVTGPIITVEGAHADIELYFNS